MKRKTWAFLLFALVLLPMNIAAYKACQWYLNRPHAEEAVAEPDFDHDGISDFKEDKNFDGIYQPLGEDAIAGTEDDETDFQKADFDIDDDGISNSDEMNIYHTDPLNPDTDGDGLPDGLEVGIVNKVLGPDKLEDGAPNGNGGYNPNDGTYANIAAAQNQSPTPTFAVSYDYNDKAIDVQRPCFIADQDPHTHTDPTLPDTNFRDDFDGIDDANYNGKVDAGEKDPSAGIMEVCVDGSVDMMSFDGSLLLFYGSSNGTEQYSGTYGFIFGSTYPNGADLSIDPPSAGTLDKTEILPSQAENGIVPFVPFTITAHGSGLKLVIANKSTGETKEASVKYSDKSGIQ